METDQLQRIIFNFENREFQSTENSCAETIVEFVRAFEDELFIKKDLTDDERKIVESLKLLKS
jgi:uncharacterized protein YeeX (DUF496 family)